MIGRARPRGAGLLRRIVAGEKTIGETAAALPEEVSAAAGVVVVAVPLLAKRIGLVLAAVVTTLSEEQHAIDAVRLSRLLQRSTYRGVRAVLSLFRCVAFLIGDAENIQSDEFRQRGRSRCSPSF